MVNFRLCAATAMFLAATVNGRAQNVVQDPTLQNLDNCHTGVSFNAGVAQTRICISSTGNVTRFQTGGVEHIRVSDVFEGYMVCLGDPFAGAFDWGVHSSGWASGVSISQPNGPHTLPLRITRNGNSAAPIRMVQEFTARSRPYGPTELIINTKVYNTGTVAIPGVKIWRFFDGDVNGDFADEIALRTAHSAVLTDPNGTPQSMVLTAGILDKPHSASITDISSLQFETSQGGASRCDTRPYGLGPLFESPQDYAGSLTYDVGEILPGRVKTVEFIYRVE